MTERPIGFERRKELAGGLSGASIGFAIGGPVGAALCGYVGARIGSVLDEEDKANKERNDDDEPPATAGVPR